MIFSKRSTFTHHIRTTALLIAFSSNAAFSQELFPTLEGSKTYAPVPKSGVFEAGLFSLDDTDLTVAKKIEQLDPNSYRVKQLVHEERGLRQGKVRIEFKYGPSRTEIKAPHGAETYKISYTSALLGSRVQTLSRSLRFKEQVSVDALHQSILEKYGKPTAEDRRSSGVDFRYQFQDGNLLTAQEVGNDVPFETNCRYTQNDMPINKAEKYRFEENREIRTPKCQGGIFIHYSYGDRDDLADFLVVRMWNYQLVNQNLLTQDQFLLNSLNQAVGSLSGKEAPKL